MILFQLYDELSSSGAFCMEDDVKPVQYRSSLFAYFMVTIIKFLTTDKTNKMKVYWLINCCSRFVVYLGHLT